MANVKKGRTNSDGSVSYNIKIYLGDDDAGRQTVKNLTWRAPAGLSDATALKKAEAQAAVWERDLLAGVAALDGKTTFAEYAKRWMETEELAFKTRDRYEGLLRRILPAIGSIKLERLRAQHLETFYRDLAKPGVKLNGMYATSTKLDDIMKKRGLSREKLGKMAGVAASTVSSAARGERISAKKAEVIVSALGMDVSKVFDVMKSSDGLSPKSIHHHHEFISAILAKAKRERLVPFNIAQEHATAPKLPRTEAKYMSKEEAKRFLQLLMQEEDIRFKTAMVVLLFTGIRRGELCGLEWKDINFTTGEIQVRRASQYQRRVGIVEVDTKNTHSHRDIDVNAFVLDVLQQYRVWWKEHKVQFRLLWAKDTDKLFIRDNGQPISPDTINFWLDKFIAKHDLPHVSPHSLRHTFATLQIASGVDLRTLQARTGHAQASTLLNIYSHALKSAQKEASDALAGVLLGEGIG